MSRGSTTVKYSNNKHVTLCLLGDSGVGKTSIALRYVRGGFNENEEPTIGAAFFKKTIDSEGVFVNFEIWDTAGQERFHSLAPMYYRGAQAALVVYDVTSDNSYCKATQWVKELKQSNASVVIGLAGNKTETDNSHVVSKEKAEEYAVENGLIFCETSAKTGFNVDEIFLQIAKTIAHQRETTPTANGGSSVQLGAANSNNRSTGCYC